MSGKIIVIEGIDGCGKETQARLLEKRLKENNIACIRMSFPMYNTPTGKIIRGPYLGKENSNSFFEEGPTKVDPHIACLYYAADRKYNIKDVLKYKELGYIVILERYTTSNLANQGGKILDKDERFNMYQWIDKLEYWLLGIPKPDKTIYLHVPYEYSKKLKDKRKSFSAKEEDFLKNAEIAYVELSELYNWDRIECIEENKLRSIEDIHEEIFSLIQSMSNK